MIIPLLDGTYKEKARADLPDVPEVAHVRCQCQCLRYGSVRIGSVVY